MEKILIIEDEQNIARMIALELSREGYQCVSVHEGNEGLEKAISGEFDLLILDVMLPGMDGFSLLEALRKKNDIPVIMLTARGELDDKVRGLDLGADDYLPKPFHMRELSARVRAHLRHPRQKKEETVLKAGLLRADRLAFRAYFGDEELTLTRKEFELLVYFMEHPDTVCSRETLLKEVWGYDYVGDTNLIDVYIRYLRTKIDDRFGVSHFRTVRGLGYSFGCEHE